MSKNIEINIGISPYNRRTKIIFPTDCGVSQTNGAIGFAVFREVAPCYTIGPGIVTPEIVAMADISSGADDINPRLDRNRLFLL